MNGCVYNLAYFFWFYLTDFENLKCNVITKSFSIHLHQIVKILDDPQETRNDSSHHKCLHIYMPLCICMCVYMCV